MRYTLIALLGLMAACPSPAHSQFGENFGELFFSVDDNARGDNCVRGVAAFGQFEFYLVAQIDFADDGRREENLTNGLVWWEATVVIPEDITVLTRELRPVEQARNAAANGNPDNFIVDLGTVIPAYDTPFGLIKYTAGLFLPRPDGPYHVRLQPATPSRCKDPEPHWMENAGTRRLHRFVGWESAELGVNDYLCGCRQCSVLPRSEVTFGSIKAQF